MQLHHLPYIHLSYCTNVHPGSEWTEIFDQLKNHLPELKNRLSPGKPFGIGLRLSAKAAFDLQKTKLLSEFRNWLNSEDLYVFTINGFVYGSFHGEKVKDEVYKPDWSTEDRFHYTSALIQLLAELTPEGGEGSISTSPVTYKYWGFTDTELDSLVKKSCRQLAELAHKMAVIKERDHKDLHVDIEPEPDCFLENSDEAIGYFRNHLWPVGSEYLSENYNYSLKAAEQVLKNHITVCYDTCHFALEYEHPVNSIIKLHNAGIRIGKVQLSSALKVSLGHGKTEREETAKQLSQFVEPVYLHQVLARRADGTFQQYRDLDRALKNIYDEDVLEWRIHFHVPVFVNQFGKLSSTQDETTKSLHALLEGEYSSHFEIETYTWEVLPSDLKTDLTDSIERELRWAISEMDHYSKLKS